MGLRFDPMGGGQFKAAVSAIIEAEKQPIKSLEKRKATEEAKLKLFGEFKSKFGSVQSTLDSMLGFNRFKELKAELGDGTKVMDVTLDKEKANIGSWEIEVKELAERSSMISNGFSDPNEKILGLGYINIQDFDGNRHDVYVTHDESSLNAIASKINAIPNGMVKASVLKDMSDPDHPYRLVMSAKKDGAENEIKFPQFYFVDGEEDFYVDTDKGSRNALVAVDGFEIELGSNEVGDFMSGVGVNLKQAKPGEKFTLNVKPDNQKVTEKVKKLVGDLNGVLEFINKQNQVNESTDTRSTFAGDTSLQNIEFRLRNLLHEGFGSNFTDDSKFKIVQLNEIGIEFDKKGMIQFKEEKFQKAIEKDFDSIAEAISGEKGFIAQLKQVMGGFADPGQGILKTREDGLRARINQIDRSIETKERNLEKKTQMVTDQFSRLQASLSNMQRQQQYVQSALGGGGGNPISQLLGG